MLSREAYIGGNKYSVDNFLEAFKKIDLQALMDYRSSRRAKELALKYLDEYLKMAGWSTTRRGHNYNEPSIIGLAMGYKLEDVAYYLELRRSGRPLRDRINWVTRLGGEIMIASHNTRVANELADEWIRVRDVVAVTLGYVNFRKLQGTLIFFFKSQIIKYPNDFRKALAMLHLNNIVVVIKDTEEDIEINFKKFQDFGRKAINKKRLFVRTLEELDLSRDDIRNIMSSIMDIHGLQCIPVMPDSRQDLIRAAAFITRTFGFSDLRHFL